MEDIKKQIKLQYKVSFSNLSKSLLIILSICLLIILILSVVFQNSNEIRFKFLNIYFFIVTISALIPLIIISHKEIINLTAFLGITRKKYFISSILYTCSLALIAALFQICNAIILILALGNVYNFTPIIIIKAFFILWFIFVVLQMIINFLMLLSYKFNAIVWPIFAAVCSVVSKYRILDLISEVIIFNNCFIAVLILILITFGIGLLNWICIRKLDIIH